MPYFDGSSRLASHQNCGCSLRALLFGGGVTFLFLYQGNASLNFELDIRDMRYQRHFLFSGV